MSTVLVAVSAVAAEGAVRPGTAVLALALIPTGYVLSFVRRDRRNVALKFVLAAALFVAFGQFIRGVRGATSVDDAREPLAALFLWVQVLHSFDLPRRRDLNFSFASSVALMAMAGALSLSSRFGAFVVVYAPCATATLALSHLSELRDRAGAHAAIESARHPGAGRNRRRGAPHSRGLMRPAAVVAGAATALSAIAFVALPRLPGIRVTTLPFAIARRTPVPGFSGQVLNPGLQTSGGGFSSTAYFGYGDGLDLRVRGRLSDELVMRVRSAEGAFWRAQVYDTYDGRRWTSSDAAPRRFAADFDQSITVPTRMESGGHELIQTFYIERQQPNLLFHALNARELFTPATSVHVDKFGSIRLPFVLEKDTIYSVISVVPDATADDLRTTGTSLDPRYAQLPPSLPGRVRRLANEITSDRSTTVDKVLAVQDWLRTHTHYRLDIPRDPPGRDPVDYFLFDRRQGFCEHIASAMTVLLRASGVPARLATGYTPGVRNPFSGYWEVRNSNAHAWVEVYYRGVGWIEYDPTHEVPDASSLRDDLFVVKPLVRFAGRLVPEPLRRAAGAVGRTAAAAPAVPVGLIALALPLTLLARRRRARRGAPTGPRARVAAAWLRVETALARQGVSRRPHETVHELATRARRDELVRLAEAFAKMRYGRTEPTDDDVATFEQLAGRITADGGPAFSVRA
jgi:transglutaminase-like putative cysteine protease